MVQLAPLTFGLPLDDIVPLLLPLLFLTLLGVLVHCRLCQFMAYHSTV
jgi:hypothetical protein